MWQFVTSRILVIIALIGATQGLLVIGPKSIRSNQDYTVVITNFKRDLKKVNLMLRMEGTATDGTSVLDITKIVDLKQNMNLVVNFDIPNLEDGVYKITISGIKGFSFHQVVQLEFKPYSISGLVQINKPVFKPGDTVHFRVILLDTELKPPRNVKSVQVTVRDPHDNIVRKWSAGRLHAGVFEDIIEIVPTPLLGKWNISATVEGAKPISKEFIVKEYVLSTFDVDVLPSTIPLLEHQALNLTVSANYYFGTPVKGTAILELYLSIDNTLDQSKRLEVDGIGQAQLIFNEPLVIYDAAQVVRVNLTFIEQYTNRTVNKQREITVYVNPYQVVLVKESPVFRPGQPYKCEFHLKYHDGTPAKDVAVEVKVYGAGDDFDSTLTSDQKGVIKQTFRPTISSEQIDVTVELNQQLLLEEHIYKVETNSDAFVKIELKSIVMLNNNIRLSVTCTEGMTFLVYYVLSKGNIIDTGFIRPNGLTRRPLMINATSSMIPKSKILVVTMAKDILVQDSIEIEFDELRNNFRLRIDDHEVKPGRQIELDMTGRPGSYVALAAYDRSLLQHNGDHDVFRENIVEAFDDLHGTEDNIYDSIHALGLFARTMDNIQFEGASDKSARDGMQSGFPETRLVPYRTNFQESWLWKNITMHVSGRSRLIEVVPDTTTSWYLTGFSIDPVYGLGIIKKPIELTTVQPFYIVENLPYSIKRNEAVVLQFTLFNNLGGEFIADVTMYNVANQTEFIGRPASELSYTKPISVPPKVGVPVSFLVKARKLGEMAVRVKATIMVGREADAIEKVIRVLPESLVEKRIESRIFSSHNYANQSFPLTVDMNKKADVGSQKITLTISSNLLSSVVKNLDNLLSVPSGCGEQNMVRFVPNVIVLDYLTAIGSDDTALIEKATNMLRKGYQNQIKYRQTDNSFGVWQNRQGSVFLTAFVAKSMQTAAKYITEVDASMVEKAFEWLASKQHSSGRFDETGQVIHKDMQGGLRDGIALSSYVLIAFLENENAKLKYASVIERGVKYVGDRMAQVTDVYDFAIATYALMLSNHYSKEDLYKKLVAKSNTTTDRAERYWHREAHGIETTAYALLSMVLVQKYPDGVPVMRWLVRQRMDTGSFPRTQDTFVGLKALTKLAEVISPKRNDYTVQLKYGSFIKTFPITSQEISAQTFDDIPGNTRKMEINVAGRGFAVLDVKSEWLLDLQNYEHRFKLTVQKLNTTSDYELKLGVCASFVPKLTDTRSNMALVEVNFPSGYVVEQSPISEASMHNPIERIEIRFGGTSVVLYYNNMGTEHNCFKITAYRRFKVAMKRPAFVLVHDFYEPRMNALQVYEVDQQNLCDICEMEDCPADCNM